MDFGGSYAKVWESISVFFSSHFCFDQMEDDGDEEDTGEININSVTVLLDLAFANNVRYLDDHEMYLTDQVSDPPPSISLAGGYQQDAALRLWSSHGTWNI